MTKSNLAASKGEVAESLRHELSYIAAGATRFEREKRAWERVLKTTGELRAAIKNATFALRYSAPSYDSWRSDGVSLAEEMAKYEEPKDDEAIAPYGKLGEQLLLKQSEPVRTYTLVSPKYCPLCLASLDWAVDRNQAMCGKCRIYVAHHFTQLSPDPDRPEHEEALKAGPGDMMGLMFVVCYLLPYLMTGQIEARAIPEHALPFWHAYNDFPDRPEDAESFRRAKRVWEMRLGKAREIVR